MRIALLSSVFPRETVGGEIILWRHVSLLLERHPEAVLRIFACEEQPDDLPGGCTYARIARRSFMDRLSLSRFHRIAHDFIQNGLMVSKRDALEKVEAFQPDLILTVAHGELFPVALTVSRRLDLPLYSIYHDWWPDIARTTTVGGRILNGRFLKLARDSKRNLCVSEGMIRELGSGPRNLLLYPVPSFMGSSGGTDPGGDSNSPRRLVYTGTLKATYGRMVLELYKLLKSDNSLEMVIAGDEPEWTPEERQRVGGGFIGLVQADVYDKLVRSGTLLLVVMSFEPAEARRARTSFPSKLVQYCQSGNPVLIWGPPYASAAEWARQTGGASVVTDPDPGKAAAAVRNLLANPEKRRKYALRAREAAETLFAPEALQERFESSLGF